MTSKEQSKNNAQCHVVSRRHMCNKSLSNDHLLTYCVKFHFNLLPHCTATGTQLTRDVIKLCTVTRTGVCCLSAWCPAKSLWNERRWFWVRLCWLWMFVQWPLSPRRHQSNSPRHCCWCRWHCTLHTPHKRTLHITILLSGKQQPRHNRPSYMYIFYKCSYGRPTPQQLLQEFCLIRRCVRRCVRDLRFNHLSRIQTCDGQTDRHTTTASTAL